MRSILVIAAIGVLLFGVSKIRPTKQQMRVGQTVPEVHV